MFSIQGLADSEKLAAYMDSLDGDLSLALDDSLDDSADCLFKRRCLMKGSPHSPSLCMTEELRGLHDLANLITRFQAALRKKGFATIKTLEARKPDEMGIYLWTCPLGRRHVRRSLTLQQLIGYAEVLPELIDEFVEARDAVA